MTDLKPSQKLTISSPIFSNIIWSFDIPGCDDEIVLVNPNERRYPDESLELDVSMPCLGVKLTGLYLPLVAPSLAAVACEPFCAPGCDIVFVLLISQQIQLVPVK